jgi:hypothetical protein
MRGEILSAFTFIRSFIHSSISSLLPPPLPDFLFAIPLSGPYNAEIERNNKLTGDDERGALGPDLVHLQTLARIEILRTLQDMEDILSLWCRDLQALVY